MRTNENLNKILDVTDSGHRCIIGRPLDLAEKPSNLSRDYFLCNLIEFKPYQVETTIKYLLSDTPIDSKFWKKANYDQLDFDYGKEELGMSTNHGLERFMNDIIKGSLDVSYLILYLSKLLPISMSDKDKVLQFTSHIQERIKDGIVKEIL